MTYLDSVLNNYGGCGLFTCPHYLLAGFLISLLILVSINSFLYWYTRRHIQKYYPETTCDGQLSK